MRTDTYGNDRENPRGLRGTLVPTGLP